MCVGMGEIEKPLPGLALPRPAVVKPFQTPFIKADHARPVSNGTDQTFMDRRQNDKGSRRNNQEERGT